MNVEQFRYSADNLAYLVWNETGAVAVDGGAAEDIRGFLAERNLPLLYVTNTHRHYDHTLGNEALLALPGARFMDPGSLPDGGDIELGSEAVRVHRTPGHTEDSVCFQAGSALLTGDTLFNGTVGNCFSGDLLGFLGSVRRLMAFPVETMILAGHDYVRDALLFARKLDPSSLPALEAYWRTYDPAFVCSSLREERSMNPYLRFNDPGIVAVLRERGLPRATEEERWLSLMSIE
ncbi:MAG: MBL fold metallo-hydrolase [Syntrophaceae bacterium]|nr:MBL fold metallo-hydrolase [Syntrophaceae bacterium]